MNNNYWKFRLQNATIPSVSPDVEINAFVKAWESFDSVKNPPQAMGL